MLSYKQLNPIKRIFYNIRARTSIIQNKLRFHKMRDSQLIRDQLRNGYNKDLSYRMNWLNLQKQSTLAQWDSTTDVINGGSSTGQLFYNMEQKCGTYEGYVQTKDKDKMIYYPFINLMRTYPGFVKLGPLRLVQVEAKTDGKPIQVHFILKSFIKGEVNIYGFIVSKSTKWHTYEIPIENMILRGTQQDYHQGSASKASSSNPNYFSKHNMSTIFDKEFQSLKKIIRTQIPDQDSLQISNIGFRLVSTQQSEQRNIQIKNVNFCYKKGYEKFAKYYQSPYMYIVEDSVKKDRENNKGEFQFLDNGLDQLNLIDTGDIKYYKDGKKDKSFYRR